LVSYSFFFPLYRNQGGSALLVSLEFRNETVGGFHLATIVENLVRSIQRPMNVLNEEEQEQVLSNCVFPLPLLFSGYTYIVFLGNPLSYFGWVPVRGKA
jgi:hypothetical protein